MPLSLLAPSRELQSLPGAAAAEDIALPVAATVSPTQDHQKLRGSTEAHDIYKHRGTEAAK